MKYSNAIAMSSIMVWVVGCASAHKVVVQDTVGPCHRVAASGASEGSLLVYSARERAPLSIQTETFFWNADFGKNEFLYETAHSDYRIFDRDGTVVEQVRNGQDRSGKMPAQVRLAPGRYTLEAEAERGGGTTMTVMIPLVVEAGQITTVHLEPTPETSGETTDPSRVVMLADGRIIGCRAEQLLSQYIPGAAPARP